MNSRINLYIFNSLQNKTDNIHTFHCQAIFPSPFLLSAPYVIFLHAANDIRPMRLKYQNLALLSLNFLSLYLTLSLTVDV